MNQEQTENPETAWVDDSGFPLPEIQVDPAFVEALRKEEEDLQRYNDYVTMCGNADVVPMDYETWCDWDRNVYQKHAQEAGSVLSPATYQRLSEIEAESNKLNLSVVPQLQARVELLEGHVKKVDEENDRLVKIITDSDEEIVALQAQINRSTPTNYALYPHYFRETPNTTHVDVNWFLEAWGVGHTVGHAVKKLMCLGQRGVKGKLQDLEEARNSINRAIELEQTK